MQTHHTAREIDSSKDFYNAVEKDEIIENKIRSRFEKNRNMTDIPNITKFPPDVIGRLGK